MESWAALRHLFWEVENSRSAVTNHSGCTIIGNRQRRKEAEGRQIRAKRPTGKCGDDTNDLLGGPGDSSWDGCRSETEATGGCVAPSQSTTFIWNICTALKAFPCLLCRVAIAGFFAFTCFDKEYRHDGMGVQYSILFLCLQITSITMKKLNPTIYVLCTRMKILLALVEFT
jgi:hypothetical protein